MKTLLISSLLVGSITLNDFKNLLTKNQEVLEEVHQGMTKKLMTSSKVETEFGQCAFTETAVQTVLKIEASKIIIYSKELFTPAQSEACLEAGYEAYEEIALFYEDKPSLAAELADLDAAAADIRSLSMRGNIITMNLNYSENEELTIQYDLTKSAFNNMVMTKSEALETKSEILADIDVHSLDLTNVLFCTGEDSQDCVEGNYSDLLF